MKLRRQLPAARALLFTAIAGAAYPVRSYPVAAGLDASWVYALNYARLKGLISGRDAIFTYGPLAWLTVPMDLGSNLAAGIVFQLACWLAFAGVLAWFVFVRKAPLEKVAVFTFCLLAGWRSFHHWDYVGPEVFIAFLALLLLGGAAVEQRWLPYFAGSCFLGWLLFFVKFSAALLVLSAVTLFIVAVFPFDRHKARRLGVAALLTTACVMGPAALFYFPGMAEFAGYVRGGIEISSGYSAAMTVRGPRAPLVLAIALMVSWLLLIGCLYRRRDRALPVALSFVGPGFVVFKHSFVREPFHAGMIFAFTPLLWGIVVLFSDLGRKDYPRLAAPVSVFAAVMCATAAPAMYPTRLGLAADRLPESIREAIGTEPVAVFPHELAYAAANGLNFRPFPVLQSYSAYTSYLDEANAAFLGSEVTAPPRVLFDWQSIDGRNPLLDAPATALALYRHYDLAASGGGHLVLRRRTVPRFGAQPRLLETRYWQNGRPFPVPQDDHLLIARIHLQETLEGTARSLLFRLPAVTLMNYRVSPEVMRDGIPLNILPWNMEEARELFAGEAVPGHNTEWTFAGPGARYFRDPIKVELLEFPEIRVPHVSHTEEP
ncbi:MAG TPA: hypothetical protein VKT49_01635 [Bryobacteraceae bacterium]|nr:hypothetical protein [Bryobacteraceae bacterium]